MLRSSRLCTLTLAVLGAVAILAPAAFATVRYVNPDGLCGGGTPCYTTLQAAIAASAPGDMIGVQPGIYPLAATVLVNVPVQIYGPQAGVTPLPSKGTTRVPGSSTEAVFDGGGALGTLIRIQASNVVIDGIEVRHGTGDLIDSQTGTPTSGVAIRNSIVHGSGDEGIQLRAVTRAVIECNHVYGTTGDGINLCCNSSDGAIRWNEVHDINSYDAAIYVYQAVRTTIEGNLVYGTANNEGIKLGAKYGPDSLLAGGWVVGNLVHNTRQDGIAVYTSDTEVRCNEVYASGSENGGIYLSWGISNVVVVDNHVHDNVFDTFKWGNPAGIMIGPNVHAATVTVRNNRLSGNVPNGMTNKANDLLVAEMNWWGSPAGPGGGDPVSANVDYDPWLASPPSPPCPTPGSCEGGNPTPAAKPTWGRIKTLYR